MPAHELCQGLTTGRVGEKDRTGMGMPRSRTGEGHRMGTGDAAPLTGTWRVP